MSLTKKLTEVMGEVGRIAKTGHNDFQNYDYVTEADVLEAVRGALANRGVLLYPDISEHTRAPKANGKGSITDINVKWTFVDSESGETLSTNVPGSAEDIGDKGLYKAITGSSKYLLLKTFLLPTGDDPEKDHAGQESEEKAPTLPEPSTVRVHKLQMPKPPQQEGMFFEGQLMKVEARSGTSKKDGKPWIAFDVTINTDEGNVTASTFERNLNETAKLLVGKIVRAQVVPGKKQGYWNFLAIEEVQIE